MALFAINLIILTIGLNYALVALLSSESTGGALDPNLTGVDSRSTFSFHGFFVTVSCVAIAIGFELGYVCWKRVKTLINYGKPPKKEK